MYTIETVIVLGSAMEVFVFRPQGQGPHPALLLAQHIPMGHAGLENDPFTLTTAQRFADNGYVVAVPFIFHWWPKSDPMEKKREESRDDWMVADMQAAFGVLKTLPAVDANRIGVVGHCWGGRVAWLTACHIPQLAAMATFYGGNVKKALGAGNQPPIELARFINCPVIGFYGNNDTNPSPQDVDDYSQALTAAGIEHRFHRYDGAGHAFQNFPMPERYHQAASDDAWTKVLAFLGEKLTPI
ncbi:MAG TPA: dienelactone hydrolase family protein [Candidatus Acidoferrum sp.]|nr:dienelactone hydrolase family protein [Candidatus Acidoferrum sp.]